MSAYPFLTRHRPNGPEPVDLAVFFVVVAFALAVWLSLSGCTLRVQLVPPPVAVDAATDAWQQAVTLRLNDLVKCADVTMRACVDAEEAARKEK